MQALTWSHVQLLANATVHWQMPIRTSSAIGIHFTNYRPISQNFIWEYMSWEKQVLPQNANISSLLEFTRWSFSLYMCNWFSNNNKCSKKQGYVDALCFHRFYFAQPSCLDISQRDPEVSLQKFNQFQVSLGVTEIQFWGAPRYRDICICIYI